LQRAAGGSSRHRNDELDARLLGEGRVTEKVEAGGGDVFRGEESVIGDGLAAFGTRLNAKRHFIAVGTSHLTRGCRASRNNALRGLALGSDDLVHSSLREI